MGYRRVPVIYTLDKIPGEEGLIVRMKTISFGKVRRIIALMDDETGDDSVMDEISDQVSKALVSWNLEAEDGTEVPATGEGMEGQDFDLVLKIVNSWLDAITGVSKDLGKDSSSGEKFPGQPLTMEAL
jgi:hypothetical protein